MTSQHTFLDDKYKLNSSEEVESAVHRSGMRNGEKVQSNVCARIGAYLQRFQEILDRKEQGDRRQGVDAFKKILYRNCVIRPEDVPESYFDAQRRIAHEQGYGDREVDDEMRQQLIDAIVADQKSSLDIWVDYLASSDAVYPLWLKYFALRSITTMSGYDKEKKRFGKRAKGTTKPFPDLNREALAYVLDAMKKEHGELEQGDQEQLARMVKAGDFAKLYAWAIEKVTPASADRLTVTEGGWVKYQKGTDHLPLVQSLQGHGTGWCTAGESTARQQLDQGDFYVYYSKSADGQYTIPRAAIRMTDNRIAEVRGIAEQQNLDPYIGPVVQKKLTEFPDGEVYNQKTENMRQLTSLSQKTKANKELTIDELKFLYELERPIQGFGYTKDPRIAELRSTRQAKQDLAKLFCCDEDQIALSSRDIKDDTRVVVGNVQAHDLPFIQNRSRPLHIVGSLSLAGLPIIQFPERVTVSDSIDLQNCTSLVSLQNMQPCVNGDINLQGCTSLTDLQGIPQTIAGDLNLCDCTGLLSLRSLPRSLAGELALNRCTGLTSLEGLDGLACEILRVSGCDGLSSFRGLEKAHISIFDAGNCTKIRSCEGMPPSATSVDLRGCSGLTSLQGVPVAMDSLYIAGCTNLRSLEGGPRTVTGDLTVDDCTALTSLKGMPESIGGDFSLQGCINLSDIPADIDARVKGKVIR